MENYKKLKKIGSGSQGECYLAQDTKTDKMCVIKEVDLGPLTPQEKQEAWNETRILQNLEPYPNVIDYLDAHLDAEGEKLSLVIEYADNGDLATQVLCRKSLLDEQNDGYEAARQAPPGSHRNLSDTPFFQEKHIMLVFVQCLFGLHHLHKNSIMHRDIKTHNILLFSNGLVKLGDFGVAKSFKRTKVRKSYVGSPLYMAPEIHSSKGQKFARNNVIQLAMEVTNAPPPTYLEVPPRTYAVDLLHLINRMLQKDPELRPSTAEIIRMPFVYKYSESLANRYKALHYFKQIHEEFKGTLRDLPPASPCLEAENMRGQDTAVKTVTEEELFASAEEAMPTAVIEPRHTQEQGLSRGGRLASATKPLDLQYGTYYFGSLDEGAVGTVETLISNMAHTILEALMKVQLVGYQKRTSTSQPVHWFFSVHPPENLSARWSGAANVTENVNLGACEIHEYPWNRLCLPCRYVLKGTAPGLHEHSRETPLESRDNPVGVSTMIHGQHATARVSEIATDSSFPSNFDSSCASQENICVGSELLWRRRECYRMFEVSKRAL
ncbi:LOW QUALITY PROTEIN: NEK kinase, putative [Eimeria mitis]|uniref:non-specific serine/threonine protein kinase n=1 Tax=Eimeria mitis TaxID=44415 RepID=U6K4R1_9EIME|nr:LOW QUALITY PROTEIN: NEK kinase, putative [Eimeria mitis]CDJ31946.1 NEK kinase, putative [Eimeria mitis]